MINHDNSDHSCLGCPIPIDEHAVSVCLPKWCLNYYMIVFFIKNYTLYFE